jgi:hypothetical protein
MHKVNEIFNLRTNNLLLYECLEQVTKGYKFDEKEKKEMLEFLEPLGNGVSCFDGEWRDYVTSPQILKSEGAAS